jgi:hypothetical protein
VKNPRHKLFALVSFLLPFCLYWFTKTTSLGFADAGEMALVTRIGGIAHAPGFPSYVLSGWLFSKLANLVTGSHLLSMVLFSALCNAAASLLLFLAGAKLIAAYSENQNPNSLTVLMPAFGAALSFATGYTVWHWANSVEVYAFHLLVFAWMIDGLVSYHFERRKRYLFQAASGLAMALANHHLTVIFFLPFVVFFFKQNFLRPVIQSPKSRKNLRPDSGYFSILFSRDFRFFILITAAVTALFYGWMFVRAGQDMVFKFGQPDNFSRLIYHLAGGAWQKNTALQTEGLIALRFPYFTMLLIKHLFLFIPFAITGFVFLFRKKQKALAGAVMAYFLLLFFYQLRIDQTADTDAYLLLPFFILGFPVATGIYAAMQQWKWVAIVVPALLALQIAIYFPIQNKKDFNVSESLMRQLDECTPPGAVLLISDWTLVSQFNYFRFGEHFRPDIILLNYDLKFTNWKLLPYNYPHLYRYIKPEYDRFIDLLGRTHPQEIYNTGCTLNTPELMNAYVHTVLKIKAFCRENKVAFMSDPRAFLFLKEYQIYGKESHMSGMFVSEKPTGLGASFLTLPFEWLHSKQLLSEPAATDKIVDFEAALDFSRNYYRLLQDTVAFNQAEKSYRFIKELQKKLKTNMPFVYRPKER